MNFFSIQPPPSLSGIVNFFWVSRWDHTNAPFFTYYSIAETYTKLVFMYKISPGGTVVKAEDFYSAIQGQTDTHERFPTPGMFEIFGVSLQPAAVPRLFGFSAPEIHNHTLDFPTMFGRAGEELDEQMAFATANRERLHIVSRFLENQLQHNNRDEPAIISAVNDIRANGGVVNISGLAKKYFLSQKQFKRRFKKWSGFTPKKFARITRFEMAVDKYPSFHSLTEMSHAMGYYDQSHFIRDFKEFSGFNPKQYFSLTSIQNNM